MTCGVLCCHDGINEDKFFSKELAIEFRTCGTSDSSIIMKSNISPNESQCHASAHREPDQGGQRGGAELKTPAVPGASHQLMGYK